MLPRPKKHKDPIKDEMELKDAIAAFKSATDISTLFQGLMRVSAEYHGPCPVCGGTDRFIVEPKKNKAWCRQCNVWGDTLYWAVKMSGADPEQVGTTRKYLIEKGYLAEKERNT